MRLRRGAPMSQWERRVKVELQRDLWLIGLVLAGVLGVMIAVIFAGERLL